MTGERRRVDVRVLGSHERPWLAEHLALAWGGSAIISGGRLRVAARLDALVAVSGETLAGLATFDIVGPACELVTLEAFREGQGVGSALLAAVVARARRGGCERLWLVTTNDNLRALRFYQRRGMRLVAVLPGAVDAARALEPAIPRIGAHGIAMRDELELELLLR